MKLNHICLGSDLAYDEGIRIQEEQWSGVFEGNSDDTYFSLEHEPVYTIGRTRDKSSLLNPDFLPHPTVEISRGGQATYHGPGQLVGYVIADLKNLGKDLHTFIRAIEEALILACADVGVNAEVREGLTGVWVGKDKLASIGVGVKKWISMHGFAINVTEESLSGFNYITPCGIQGVKMTHLTAAGARTGLSVREFADLVLPHLETCLGGLEGAS